jgi:hypothetical protein
MIGVGDAAVLVQFSFARTTSAFRVQIEGASGESNFISQSQFQYGLLGELRAGGQDQIHQIVAITETQWRNGLNGCGDPNGLQ